jgi:PLP dependent protein
LIDKILQQLKPFGARLVAVSKTQPAESVLLLYNEGQRIFGENRVQELLEKKDLLPPDIEWHLIGHLQRNKAKYVVSFIAMIHSLDSIDLAHEINRQAEKTERRIPVLLQIRIASEETKFGIKPNELDIFMRDLLQVPLPWVKVCGVMGMASFVEDQAQIRTEFRTLRETFVYLKGKYYPDDPDFKELSMGMSGDYQLALQEGSTLVRIGTLLFGPRL